MDHIKIESFCSACIKYSPWPRCTLSYPILALPFPELQDYSIPFSPDQPFTEPQKLDDPSFYMKTYHGTRRSRHSIRHTRATPIWLIGEPSVLKYIRGWMLRCLSYSYSTQKTKTVLVWLCLVSAVIGVPRPHPRLQPLIPPAP